MIKRMLAILIGAVLMAAPALAQGSAVVAQIGGVQITRAELDAVYEVSYGDLAGDDEQTAYDLRYELVSRMLEETAVKLMQEKMGFDKPSQEEIDRTTALAQQEYEEYRAYYASMLDDGSMSGEELYAMTDAYLAAMDMSQEDYIEQAIAALADEKLRAWALEGVSVGEAEIKAAYEAMVQDEKALYSVYPDSFLSCALYGMPYLYVPAGVRQVRQIVIAFDADQKTEYAFLYDAQTQGADVQADMDALYAQLDARVNEVMLQLGSGKSFADVEAEYSDDWTMLESGVENAGYFVCEGAEIWDRQFTDAAMALGTPGEISQPVRMADGVHILCYEADVPEGAVEFELVRDYVEESAVYQAETDAYRAAVLGWMEELGAHIYLEELE